MSNVRRTLAIKVQTPGGDNPLLMQLVGDGPFFRGIAVTGLALVGKGGVAPYSFSILAGGDTHGDIDGLTLNTDGTFSGTPDSAGRFVFVAEIQDSAASVFTHSFSITVKAQLFVVAGLPTPGEVGVPYSYQFVVRDGAGTTLTSGYVLTAGNLPAGLSLTSAGLLHGTPTAPDGISYFTISAGDGTDTIDIPCVMTVYAELSGSYLEDRDPPAGWGGGAGTWLPAMTRLQDWFAHLVITGGVGPYSISPSDINPPPTGIKVVQQQRLVYGRTPDTAVPDPVLMSVFIQDALGGFFTLQRAVQIIDSPNGRVMPQRNGSDLSGGNGFTKLDIVEGFGVSIAATNDGETARFQISAIAGGGGILTINGVGSDTDGNLHITGVSVDSNGDLFIQASGQDSIQFKDEGINLGAPGTVSTVDFVGAGVTAARVGNVITVTVAGGSASPLTTKGDLYGFDTADARVPVGANDLPLVADSSDAQGVSYKVLPIAGGGTGQSTKTAAFDALSPLTTKGDIATHDGTDSVRQGVGANDTIPIADSSQANGWRWGSKTIVNTFDPRVEFFLYDDFLYPNASLSSKDWWSSSSSAATSVPTASTSSRPGIARLTLSTGVANLNTGAVFSLGGGAIKVRFSVKTTTLSTGTNRYSISAGLRDTFSGASSDGLTVFFVDNVNSGKFVLRNVISGVTTDANSTLAVAANTWYDCVIDIPAGGGSSTLTINGTLAVTNAAAVTAALLSLGAVESVTVGSGVGINIDWDYFEIVGYK